MADPSDEHYLTTAEVAARLKVKPETVYAYVSRGLLASTRARGRRGSLFLKSEVDRLAGRTVDHPGAIERIESQLTLITDDELYYRGHRVRDLVTTHSVESVASLLWTGTLLPPAPAPAPRSGGTATAPAGQGLSVGASMPDRQGPSVAASVPAGQGSSVEASIPDGSSWQPGHSNARSGAGGDADGRDRAGTGHRSRAAGRGLVGTARSSRPGSSEPAGRTARSDRPEGSGPTGRRAWSSFPAPDQEVELARRAVAAAPEGARLTDKLRIAVAVLGAGDPLRYDLSPHAVELTARRLLGVLVTALPGADGDSQTFGGRLWPKLGGDAQRASASRLLDAAVVVLADHGLAVSTIAARVAASTRANLYAVVSAGLGALDGHLHGAAPTLAYEFLGRALDNPTKALSDQLRSGEPVPGFGHKIYRQRDPRAEVLLGMLAGHPVIETVEELTARVPSFPNSDLALAAILHTHQLPAEAGEAVFALARMIGWTAHALEEYAAPPLRFRTLGVYTGLEAPTH